MIPRNRGNRNTVRSGWNIEDARRSAKSAWFTRIPGQSPKCEVCGYKWATNLSNFHAHVRTHVAKRLIQTQCLSCSETFSGNNTLTRHMMKYHPGDKVGDGSNKNDSGQIYAALSHRSAGVNYPCDADNGVLMLQGIFGGIHHGITIYIERSEVSVKELGLIFGIVDEVL